MTIMTINPNQKNNTTTNNHNTSEVHYHLNFARFTQHLVDVTLTFTADQDTPTLWLPSWIPGSYLMREFSRNITAVHYQLVSDFGTGTDNGNGNDLKNNHDSSKTIRASKNSKSEWQLNQVQAGQKVVVSYEVYCYDLSVRTAYVDQTRLYGNFTSLALAVTGQEQNPVSVSLTIPQRFVDANHNIKSSKMEHTPIKIACGLKHEHLKNAQLHQFNLNAENYHELIDYPFEIAAQDEFSFVIHDAQHQPIAHRFFISGKHSANLGRLQQDVTQICQTYLNWLGDAPFGNEAYEGYTFMTFASGNDYGGLEHINSTSLVTPRSDLPTTHEKEEPSENYQRFLGLCSHEYFHAWWVKTVRPDVMIDVDLRTEAYTPLLWVFEGFTSYIDDFMLQASGVVSKDSYLKLLQAQINRYTQTHGRQLQSVAESSFDAWIKLYRADENTGNAGISYYNKGALVAMCLDLTIMQHSGGKYRLFDVVKAFYGKAKEQSSAGKRMRIGMDNDNLEAIICQYIDKSIWQDFKARYVDGVEELPINSLLQANGVSLNPDEKDNTLPWGMTIAETSEGLKVNKVLRDSVASEAGISAKDVLVAIDGIKATKKHLQSVAESNLETITCHAFRRDELMTFEVANKTSTGVSSNPSLDKVALKLAESGYEAWLTPSFVK